jgi:hypothetical protein
MRIRNTGCSKHTAVTEDYTRRMKLKKIRSGFQVIGFGSSEMTC